ncbi:MAG: hypothetical protein KQH63_00090 [Desulfobulbaceae bacterium]|nr:hypothetical protein [Desulfobulbaceae bacterium]
MKKILLALLFVVLFPLSYIGELFAAPYLYVHDANRKLATVDIATGDVAIIGQMPVIMTDIAYSPSGELYGISFTDMYLINPENNAASQLIGPHGIPNANALVFGHDGTLYAAGTGDRYLHTIDPISAASSVYGEIGHRSAGDLAFYQGDLYLSSYLGQLIKIDLTANAAGTVIGTDFGYEDVFGLATAENGILYGVSETTIFQVDIMTGSGSFVLDYGGQGLGNSYGSTFILESIVNPPPPAAIPVPGAIWFLGSGALGVIVLRRKEKRPAGRV